MDYREIAVRCRAEYNFGQIEVLQQEKSRGSISILGKICPRIDRITLKVQNIIESRQRCILTLNAIVCTICCAKNIKLQYCTYI